MLGEFSEVNFSYEAKFLITVKWLDHRLEFADLKSSMFDNMIGSPEKDALWIPPLIFNNSEKNTMLKLDREVGEPEANLLVEKRGSPRVAPPTVLDETLFYKGSENLLVYRTEYNLQFQCVYELGYYPFDIQTCTIQVIICITKRIIKRKSVDDFHLQQSSYLFIVNGLLISDETHTFYQRSS